jgi:DNA primase
MSIFEEVKQELNIRQVVEHYGYKVNRAGQFICPFHNDHKPSASIKNDYFNCFVCGAGGDVITFTARLHGLKNYDACKKLASDFNLHIATAPPQTAIDRLKADRERVKKQAELKKQKELEELIQHTGSVLADYHRYLWQGIQFYPFEHKRHIRGLQRLTEAQYYLKCYDSNPEEYSKQCRKQVGTIERRLYQWHNEVE